MKVNHYTRNDLIRGLRERDNRVLEYIYISYWDHVRNYVEENGGALEDAEDMFQEALMTLHLYALDEAFELKVKFRIILTSLVRKIMEKRKRNHVVPLSLDEAEHIESDDQSVEDLHDRSLLSGIIGEMVRKTGKLCRELLEMFLSEFSNEQMAEKLGLSITRIYKRKKICKDRLRSLIYQHPEFRRIKRVENNIIKGDSYYAKI